MIRVFVLAVLAFAALLAIANNLPESGPAAPSRPADAEVEELSIFSRWNGRWEGTLTAYRPDGATISSVAVQRDHASVSPTEQSVTIRFEYDDGRRETTRVTNSVVDGRLESRVRRPDGGELVLNGRQADGALFWYWRDDSIGAEESRREAILELTDGDLFTVDGVRHGASGSDDVVILEGRYRRVEREID